MWDVSVCTTSSWILASTSAQRWGAQRSPRIAFGKDYEEDYTQPLGDPFVGYLLAEGGTYYIMGQRDQMLSSPYRMLHFL